MADRSHYFASGEPWAVEMLSAWRWPVGDEAFAIVRVTAMGSLFLRHPNGTIHFLDTIEPYFEQVADAESEIDSFLQSSFHRKRLFWSFRVRELRQLGIVPGPGQCYSHKVLPCLGGKPGPQNMELADVTVHVSLYGQIHQQLRLMPEGAKIDEVRIS